MTSLPAPTSNLRLSRARSVSTISPRNSQLSWAVSPAGVIAAAPSTAVVQIVRFVMSFFLSFMGVVLIELLEPPGWTRRAA